MILSHLLNFASVVSFLCPCFPQILGDSLLVTINFCSNSSDSRKELIHTKSLYFFALSRERDRKSPLRPWPYFRFSEPVSLNLSSRNCSNNLSVCWATVASLVSWSLITEELTQETKRKLMKNNLSKFFGTPKSKLLRRHDGGIIFSSVQRQEQKEWFTHWYSFKDVSYWCLMYNSGYDCDTVSSCCLIDSLWRKQKLSYLFQNWKDFGTLTFLHQYHQDHWSFWIVFTLGLFIID